MTSRSRSSAPSRAADRGAADERAAPSTRTRLTARAADTRLLEVLQDGPSYPAALARAIGAPESTVRKALKRLEAAKLAASWTFAQADGGGRVLTVRAWRLATMEERCRGKEDPNATARASALLSRILRGRLSKVECLNRLLVEEAKRERDISSS